MAPGGPGSGAGASPVAVCLFGVCAAASASAATGARLISVMRIPWVSTVDTGRKSST